MKGSPGSSFPPPAAPGSWGCGPSSRPPWNRGHRSTSLSLCRFGVPAPASSLRPERVPSLYVRVSLPFESGRRRPLRPVKRGLARRLVSALPVRVRRRLSRPRRSVDAPACPAFRAWRHAALSATRNKCCGMAQDTVDVVPATLWTRSARDIDAVMDSFAVRTPRRGCLDLRGVAPIWARWISDFLPGSARPFEHFKSPPENVAGAPTTNHVIVVARPRAKAFSAACSRVTRLLYILRDCKFSDAESWGLIAGPRALC